MAEKNGWDEWNERKLRKALKRIRSAYKAVAVIFLVLGFAVGVLGANRAVAGDTFKLNGERELQASVGETLSYTDEGVTCISMGSDVSDKVEIRTNMERSEDGRVFTGDTSVEGEYFIEYKITEGRYAGLTRVRIFTVSNGSSDTDESVGR